jgi:hypothetical protein
MFQIFSALALTWHLFDFYIFSILQPVSSSESSSQKSMIKYTKQKKHKQGQFIIQPKTKHKAGLVFMKCQNKQTQRSKLRIPVLDKHFDIRVIITKINDNRFYDTSVFSVFFAVFFFNFDHMFLILILKVTIDATGQAFVGLSDRRTIGLSDYRTIGLSDYSYGPD